MGDPRSKPHQIQLGRVEVDLLRIEPPLSFVSKIVVTANAFRIRIPRDAVNYWSMESGIR